MEYLFIYKKSAVFDILKKFKSFDFWKFYFCKSIQE